MNLDRKKIAILIAVVIVIIIVFLTYIPNQVVLIDRDNKIDIRFTAKITTLPDWTPTAVRNNIKYKNSKESVQTFDIYIIDNFTYRTGSTILIKFDSRFLSSDGTSEGAIWTLKEDGSGVIYITDYRGNYLSYTNSNPLTRSQSLITKKDNSNSVVITFRINEIQLLNVNPTYVNTPGTYIFEVSSTKNRIAYNGNKLIISDIKTDPVKEYQVFLMYPITNPVKGSKILKVFIKPIKGTTFLSSDGTLNGLVWNMTNSSGALEFTDYKDNYLVSKDGLILISSSNTDYFITKYVNSSTLMLSA